MNDADTFDPPNGGYQRFGETGFCDPLGDEYNDNFNIIQFINGSETPIESPVTSSTINGTQQQQSQLSHFAPNTSGHFSGSAQPNQHTATMMYQDPRPTFPESPPITDSSAGGSSGSPSSISDAPYSPELYLTGSQYADNMNDVSPHQLSSEMAMQLHNSRGLHLPNGFSNVGGYGYQPQPHGVVSQVPTQSLLNRHNYFPHEMLGNIANMNMFPRDQNPCATINDLQGKKRPFQMTGMPIKTEPRPPNKQFILAQPNGMTPMTPAHLEDEPEEPHARKNMHPGSDDASNRFQFTKFQDGHWQSLYDSNQRPLHLDVKVVADKGFNYSSTDGCFVNQKKNHFQITVNIEAIDSNPPRYIKVNGHLKEVAEFKLVFCGVKHEMTSCEIMIKQSQTDRKPLPHEPVLVEIQERKRTKVTVPRLHFSETTMNNHRKHGRPNPEQKYFLLIVKLVAKTIDNEVVLIQSYQSEKVIVRASNPGQFEPPEAEATWQRNGDTLFYKGPVAIGTEQANSNVALHVNGSVFVTGELCRASDFNLKQGIYPRETKDALQNLQNIQIVHFEYKPDLAEEWGLNEENRHRVGVIAQDLEKVLPDAVRSNGQYLTVDDTRIFYETVAAAQELYQLTNQLEGKIDKVERIWKHKFGETRSLSVSRTTLCSKSPSMISVLKPKKKQKEDRCHHDQVLCSSKLTQGTIIALVVVMTFCMLAMSALYCMDWYKKNQWHDDFHRGRTSHDMIDDKPPGQIVIPGGSNVSWIPLTQAHAPMIPAYCERGPTCQESCCARPVTMLRGSLPEQTPNYLLIPPIEEGRDPKPANGLPISITLVNANITIDDRFCVGGSCTSRHGRYTLYVPLSPAALTAPIRIRVKIGPTQNLHNCGAIEEFKTEECKTTPVTYEESTRLNIEKLNEYSFQIAASKYTQSAFKFRVGRVTTMCNMQERLMGSTFDEYNIVFYRSCHTASR